MTADAEAGASAAISVRGSAAGGGACRECLRRSLLLARLSGHIERVTADRPGARSDELLGLTDAELCEALLPRGRGRQALERAGAPHSIAAVREASGAAGLWTLCAHSRSFPASLRELDGPPRALFGRGEPETLALASERMVAVVGARRCGEYGRTVAHELGRDLGAAGICVVSGLAYGVDAAAHRGALESGGRMLAVLGCGAERAYPVAHERLAAAVAGSGAVVSELPPGTRPRRWCFPARNRIMAALAETTVVVAAAHRSGSLITARIARELGRCVGAVPGPITAASAAGANALLADGALVVRGAQDVLDAALGVGVEAAVRSGPPIGSRARAVLDAVESGLSGPDRIEREVELGPAELAAELAGLELSGYLRRAGSGGYARTTLVPPEGE